ncbi:MAG: hypothetical protein ACRDOY_11130 [Nocardioidaceae bacterium]
MSPEQHEFRRRAIRAALIVAGISVGIGLIIGGLTSAAIKLTGVLPEPTTSLTPRAEETDAGSNELPTPSLAKSPSPSPTRTTRSAAASPTPAASPSPSPSPKKTRAPKPDRAIQLNTSSRTVSSYQQVTLSGRYPGGNGTTLQVQRREGGSWAAFPTSATVEGGSFSTYVALGQPGANQLRVIDQATGRASNVVVVTVS